MLAPVADENVENAGPGKLLCIDRVVLVFVQLSKHANAALYIVGIGEGLRDLLIAGRKVLEHTQHAAIPLLVRPQFRVIRHYIYPGFGMQDVQAVQQT